MRRDTVCRATALIAAALLAGNAIAIAACIVAPANRALALVSLPFLLIAQLGSLCALSCARHLARHGHAIWSWLGITASVAGTGSYFAFLCDLSENWPVSRLLGHGLLCLAGAIACALQLAEVQKGTPRRALRSVAPIAACLLCAWVALLPFGAVAVLAWSWNLAALLALAGITSSAIDTALGGSLARAEERALEETKGDGSVR